jgi:azobenzene reductase
MKVAILTGSVRPGRESHKAAYYLKNKLSERNVETDLIDIIDYPLPVMGHHNDGNADIPELVRDLSDRLHAADAIIFVTPEYHGSISGALKNTLDYFWSEFSKKPIGVAAASAGKFGGINASNQLQHVILSLGAYPVPRKLLVPEVQTAFDNSYTPQNDQLIRSTETFLDEFLWFAESVYQRKEREVAEKITHYPMLDSW